MKYQSLLAFEKHLEQAAKVQVSRVFLLVSPCAYERKKILHSVVSAIRLKEGQFHLHLEDGIEGAVEERIQALNTGSLLEGKQIVYLDNIDKLKKQELTALGEYAAYPSPFAYLILGASSSKGLSELYSKGKKELISCDLSEEKPWERQGRLKRLLLDAAVKEGKRLAGDAVEYLLENVGANLPSLEMELEKLLLYVGERREILLQDVQLLCAAQKSFTPWQFAEAIVWRESLPPVEEKLDLAFLLPLIAQLRTQLQSGLTLAILLERKAPSSEISHYLPQVKPTTLEKMVLGCKARGSAFFKRALDLLFEIELMAKNSSLEPALLLDLFLTKLTLLKRHDISLSQSSR